MSESAPPNNVVNIARLSEEEFQASVQQARDAIRARIGLPPGPQLDPAKPRAAAPSGAPAFHAQGQATSQASAATPSHVPVATPAHVPAPTPAHVPVSTPAHAFAATQPHASAPTTSAASKPAATPVAHMPHTPASAVAAPPSAHAQGPRPVPAPAATSPRPLSTPGHLVSAIDPPLPVPDAHAEAVHQGGRSPHDSAPASMVMARRSGIRISVPMAIGGILLLAGAVGAVLYFRLLPLQVAAAAPPAAVATEGKVEILSRPAGAKITVDGVPRGVAPLTLTLPVGNHLLQVEQGTNTRTLPLSIEGGGVVKQYIEFPSTAEMTGRIDVTTDPANAQVSVDGSVRGTTPLTIADVAPGPHVVTIGAGESAVTRTVEVTAGTAASVMVSLAPTAGAAGWLAIKAPLPLQVLEDGQVIAAAGVDRVMLPTGKHQLVVASDEYEFRTTVTVQVQAGKTVSATIALPNGVLSINAVPWAEVWLDGKSVGTTPLGNLSVAIGPHEIVWKHPQLGERRQVVNVKAQTPFRAGMDFRK